MLCIRKLRTPVKAYLVNMNDVAATLSTATPQGEFFCLFPPAQLQMQLRYEYMNIASSTSTSAKARTSSVHPSFVTLPH